MTEIRCISYTNSYTSSLLKGVTLFRGILDSYVELEYLRPSTSANKHIALQ